MRRFCLFAMMVMPLAADSLEKDVSGEVTYLTSSTVYTSIGHNEGIQDSTLLYIITGQDTVATLQVFAVSSKSSACRILHSSQDVAVGSRIVGTVSAAEPLPSTEEQTKVSAFAEAPLTGTPSAISYFPTDNEAPFEVSGRVSSQFYGTFQEQSEYNTSQPGIVTKLKVRSTDIPVTFDMYANFRTLFYGSDGPFSGSSRNQSRIHRFAVDYDDGKYQISLGRFAPSSVASVGYVDGLLLGTSVGRFSVGILGGFRPASTQRAVSTDYKKVAFFTNYFPGGSPGNRITVAYARTYFLSGLDREMASVGASLRFNTSFSLYAHSDFDLRKYSGGSLQFSPELSQVFVNARYRLLPAIGVGVGANATRPIYPYSTLRTLSPEFVDTQLRGGLSFSVYFYLPAGVSLTNTYSPRTSSASFADNYTEYATLTFANIVSTGVTLRTNFNMNTTDYTHSKGYGVHLSKNMWQLFDVTLRYQQYLYTIRQLDQTNQSSTIGADLMIPISRMFSIMGTYEQYKTPGIRTNTVFAELTVRF